MEIDSLQTMRALLSKGRPGAGVGQGPYAHAQKISWSLLPNVTNAEPANSCPTLWLGLCKPHT